MTGPAILLMAAAAAISTPLEMSNDQWELSGDASFVAHDGRPALRIANGGAQARGLDFSTGRISFDLLVTGERAFAGLAFRGVDGANFEQFYIRPHQSGNPDAAQYTPVVNEVSAWQIFAGEGFTASAVYPFDRWMRVTIDVHPDSACVSIDGRALMTIPDLKRDERSGRIGLTGSFAGALFSNVSVDPARPQPCPPGPAQAAPPEGTVMTWLVSPPLPEAEALAAAADRNWSSIAWREITAETNQIANLARAGPVREGRASVIARFTVMADADSSRAMAFGFSDRASIFLNGRLVYSGDDSYRSRDYRFLGTVGFFDMLHLPLARGMNEVAFVVSESFGGWAAAARFEECAPMC